MNVTQQDRDLLAAEFRAAGDGHLVRVYADLAQRGSCTLTACALSAMAMVRAEQAAGWKIVWCDGYGRPEISEQLVASGIRTEYEGNLMLAALQADASEVDRYKLVP